MNNTLLKSIAAGLLIGAALFIMPFFLVRLVIFVLLISAVFRLFGGPRFRRGGWGRGRGYGYMPAFADRIRQMNDEEYSQFKQRFEQGRCEGYEGRKSAEKPANEGTTNV